MTAQEAQGRTSPTVGTPAQGTRRLSGGPLRAQGKVLPEHARGHNRSLVLQTLFHEGAMSRADLSRSTGLTRVTISDLVAELIEEDLVTELGMRESTRPGKPAMLVDIARDAHQILAVDLSGPNEIIGAVLTLDGQVVERRSVAATAEADGDAALAAVRQLAVALVDAASAPILGLGIGTPGIVAASGVVLSAPNLGWNNLPLQELLAAELGVSVVILNDANAAVLAEHTYGNATADSLLIKVGLGVGSGLLAGGQPMIGSHFAAGEIGHVTVGTDGGPQCACGNVGCLEAWLAVPALRRRITEQGDAEGVLRDAGERLGIALAPIVGALDLSEIVLSGPADLLDGALSSAAVETLRRRTLAQFHDTVCIRMTEQGPDIVLRGAAVKVLSERLGVS